MTSSKLILKPLALACAVALASCSSGGDSASSAVTAISGVAEAPQGGIAQLDYKQSFTVAATNILFPAAHAGITGLEAVQGATVVLIRIDDDGNQVGDVLASTTTSITGDYSLALPSGVSLAGNLIVRITGSSGASMSAMVVDQEVDINPISSYILDKFVDDDDLVLADLALNEVISLQGKVEEFDLTAAPGADLSAMLDQLEAEVGQLVENEIAVIESTPDDGTAATAVAGKWNSVDLSFGMHDSDPDTTGNYWGTFSMDILSESMTFSPSTDGLTVTIGDTLIDAYTNFSVYDGGANIYHEVSLTGDSGDSFPAMIDADGNITLSFPFEEELQSVDVGGSGDPEGDGPDYGWRWPPGTEFIYPSASGNTYVTLFNEAGVRYETADTDGDGINDAVDPAARDGDEVSIDLFLTLKEGSGMDVSNPVDGDYGMVALNANVDVAPESVIDSTVGLINFNASSGNMTIAANAFEKREVTRSPATFPAVTITAPGATTEPPSEDILTYTVSATGMVTIDPAGDTLEGFANEDGSVLAFVDDEYTKPADLVTNVNNEMLVAVKLGTNMAASLNGATYKLLPMIMAMGPSGYTELVTLSNSTVTFNADSSSATLTGDERGISRDNDVAEIEAIVPTEVNEALSADVTNAGKVTLNGADGTFSFTLKGWVSADTNMLILRHFGTDSVGGDADIGMMIGIKQ